MRLLKFPPSSFFSQAIESIDELLISVEVKGASSHIFDDGLGNNNAMINVCIKGIQREDIRRRPAMKVSRL
jgi:hypothetical protein